MTEYQADVAIAGATVAGLVAARDLAAAGKRVVVVDVTPPGACSLPYGAAVVPVGPLSHEIALRHGEPTAIAYLRGLADAVAEIAQFAAEHGVAHQVVEAWGVSVDGHLAFQLRHEARLLRLAGQRVDFSDLQPFAHDVRPMLTVAGQCVVDPAAHVAALRAAAVAAGATVVGATIRSAGADGFRTEAGAVRAQQLVDTVGVLDVGVVPAVRAQRTERRPVVDIAPLSWRAGEPAVGRLAAVSTWMDTPVDQLLALPGAATVVGRPGGAIETLEAWSAAHLGASPRRTRWLATDESRDGLPVVGAVSALLPIWVARGFGSAPLAGATWGGHALAQAMLEGRRPVAKPLRLLGSVAAGVRTRFGVLADPKQRVADVLAARGLSRHVSRRD